MSFQIQDITVDESVNQSQIIIPGSSGSSTSSDDFINFISSESTFTLSLSKDITIVSTAVSIDTLFVVIPNGNIDGQIKTICSSSNYSGYALSHEDTPNVEWYSFSSNDTQCLTLIWANNKWVQISGNATLVT